MSSEAESWEIDLLGTATVIAPNGEEVTVGARLQWLMTTEQTLRFLLSFDGIPMPVVCVNGPCARHVIASSTVAALVDLTDALGLFSSVS